MDPIPVPVLLAAEGPVFLSQPVLEAEPWGETRLLDEEPGVAFRPVAEQHRPAVA